MTIAFVCGTCRHYYEVNESLAGKKGKCKQCGTLFEIPFPAADTEAGGLETLDESEGLHALAEGEAAPITRPPKPTGERRSKKRRSFLASIPLWGYATAGVIAAAMLILSLINHFFADLFIFLWAVIALVLFVVGYLGNVSVAFGESSIDGYLSLVRPFRNIYWEWRRYKRWFLVFVSGFGALLVSVFLILIFEASGKHTAEHERIEEMLGLREPKKDPLEGFAALQKLRRERAQPAPEHQPPERPRPSAKGPGASRKKAQAASPDEERARAAPSAEPAAPPETQVTQAPDTPAKDADVKGNRPGRRGPFSRPGMRPQSPFARADQLPSPRAGQPPAAVPNPQPGPGPPAPAMPPASKPQAVDIDAALTALKSDDAPRRRDALGQLSRGTVDQARRAEVARAIESALHAPGLWVRGDAARALGVWGGPENVAALIAALDDPDFPVRWAAIDALGSLKDPAGAEAVAAFLPKNAGRAAESLRAMGSVAEPAVRKYLTHENLFARAEACRILKAIGTGDSLPALKELRDRAKGQNLDGSAAAEAIRALEGTGGLAPGQGP